MEERPWGTWHLVYEAPERAVKILTVNAGCMLSLQKHRERAEYWVPLHDGLIAYTSGDIQHGQMLMAMVPFEVPKGFTHRLINPQDHAIALVEIITGWYREEDIVRYHDSYGRQ